MLNIFLKTWGFTFAQALASAAWAFLFGFLGAMGLVSVSQHPKLRKILSVFAITPNAMPVIFIIFIFIQYLPWAKGFVGILMAHAFLNVGLVSLSLYQIFQNKLGKFAEIAWIDGASRWQFLTKIVLPLLRNDFARLYFFIFTICFVSFAIPLMLGGTTLEVLIYEKIRISTDWAQAFLFSGVEILILFLVSGLIRNQMSFRVPLQSRSPLLSFLPGLIFALAPSFFFCAALAWSLTRTQLLTSFSNIFLSGADDFSELVRRVSLGSYLIAISSGLVSLIILMFLAYQKPSNSLRRFFLGFSNPSTVILGFAILFCFRQTGAATYLKIIFGLSLIHLPILYRLSWDNQIFSLRKQIEIAETIGASKRLIFSKVISPQLIGPAYNLAGLAALWSFADFTFAQVVAEKDLTLAQVFAHLTESYRFEQAETLLIPMIVGSLLCFILFSGVGYVASRSSQS